MSYRSIEKLRSALPSNAAEQLESSGYVIVDNILGSEWSSCLHEDCTRMKDEGDISQHYFQFGDKRYKKPGIFEADLHDVESRAKSEEFTYIYEHAGPALVSAFIDAFPSLKLSTSESAIKMQYNNGKSGCFPYHYDNPGPPSTRQLTCIVYLNSTWREGDGGELVLWPFLSRRVKIAPVMDRAVIFRSDLVLHRVLPSTKERFCFTVWCDGTAVNSKEDTLLTRDKLQFRSFDDAEAFFRFSPLQRVISRAVYAQEYEESLRQCVGGTDGEEPMLRQHTGNVAAIESKLRPLIEEFRARKARTDISTEESIN